MNRLLTLAIITLVSTTAFAAHWTDTLRKRSEDVRVGMTTAEVRASLGKPFSQRAFRQGTVDITEFSYPTGEKRLTTFVFEGDKLTSRKDRTADAFVPAMSNFYSSEERALRDKLRKIFVGMSVTDLDALQIKPDSTVTAAEIHQMRSDAEFSEWFSTLVTFAADALHAHPGGPMFADLDERRFDDIRSWELMGEVFYVETKDRTVIETGISATPDEKWVSDRLTRAVRKRTTTRTASDFANIKPGTPFAVVVFKVGMPTSEERVRTEAGAMTVFKYRLSRRAEYEIEVKDDVVTKVTDRTRY